VEYFTIGHPRLIALDSPTVLGFFWGIVVHLVEPLKSRVPEQKQTAFLTAAWAHRASYLTVFIGRIILCLSTWKRKNEVVRNPKLQILNIFKISRHFLDSA